MTAESRGQKVARIWESVVTESQGPGHFFVLETKDGRRFVSWAQFAGRVMEAYASYRAHPGGKRDRFKLSRFEPTGERVTVSGHECLVYRQRPGRHEPKWTRTPESWVPIERAPADLADIKPKPIDYWDFDK